MRTLDLRRVLTETFIVVAGILIAFALDSGWDRAQDRSWERAQLSSLRTELEANLEHSVRVGGAHLRTRESLERMRDWSRESMEGDERSFPTSDAIAVITWRTSEFSLGVLDALRSSGNLGRLRSSDLRSGLTSWLRLLDDVAEKESLARDFVESVVTPTLSGQGFIGDIYDIRPPWGAGESVTPITVRASPMLSDLLAARVAHERMASVAQDDLAEETRRLLDLIVAELPAGGDAQ